MRCKELDEIINDQSEKHTLRNLALAYFTASHNNAHKSQLHYNYMHIGEQFIHLPR